MASPVVFNKSAVMLSAGQGHKKMDVGTAAFTTTGTNVAVPTDLTVVEAVFLSPVQSHGDYLFGPTGLGTAPVLSGTNGTITISRATGTTSGLKFSYIFIGN